MEMMWKAEARSSIPNLAGIAGLVSAGDRISHCPGHLCSAAGPQADSACSCCRGGRLGVGAIQ